MTLETRTSILLCDDDALLRQCRCETCRGSGRGGQKRNRTDSAVRLTHLETGVSASSDATRSQHSNRRDALRKLRGALALACRCQPPGTYSGAWCPGAKSRDYVLWVAWLLDVLAAVEYRLGDATEFLGVSTGRLVRDLAGHPTLWQHVNAQRLIHGHGALRPPSR